MVNTQYHVDHWTSKRYNFIASNSLLSTGNHRHHDINDIGNASSSIRHDYHRQNATTTTADAIGKTRRHRFIPATQRSLLTTQRPLMLTVAHRRHRFRQRHDRYRKHIAATATGNATTATGNTSPPPLLATPRPLPETHRRYKRYRQHIFSR